MQSEQIDKLAEALAKAQSVITSPPRNREVSVRAKTKDGTPFTYTFKYATLDGIIEHVRGPLTSNGIWFTQTLANGDGKYRLITRLVHASGQWIASETPLLVDGSKNQEFGSALTYMKRYALAAMLGVAADEDDDANAADGNTVESSKDRAPARPKPAPVKAVETKISLPAALQTRAKEISLALKAAKTQAEADRILALNEKDLAAIEAASVEAIDLIRSYAMKEQAA
jgi:hypothetical protein